MLTLLNSSTPFKKHHNRLVMLLLLLYLREITCEEQIFDISHAPLTFITFEISSREKTQNGKHIYGLDVFIIYLGSGTGNEKLVIEPHSAERANKRLTHGYVTSPEKFLKTLHYKTTSEEHIEILKGILDNRGSVQGEATEKEIYTNLKDFLNHSPLKKIYEEFPNQNPEIEHLKQSADKKFTGITFYATFNIGNKEINGMFRLDLNNDKETKGSGSKLEYIDPTIDGDKFLAKPTTISGFNAVTKFLELLKIDMPKGKSNGGGQGNPGPKPDGESDDKPGDQDSPTADGKGGLNWVLWTFIGICVVVAGLITGIVVWRRIKGKAAKKNMAFARKNKIQKRK